MAAKSGVLVCLYADGVGLRETVQQLSMFDSVALTGTGDRRQATGGGSSGSTNCTSTSLLLMWWGWAIPRWKPSGLDEIRPESRADLC
jgi:hypothetical protein